MSSQAEAKLQLRCLGPFGVLVDDEPIELGGRRQRAVLALLVARHPDIVSVDAIIEAVWGELSFERSASNVQVYVSNLRKALRATSGLVGIETQAPGYRLLAPDDVIDWKSFDAAVTEGLDLLGAGDHDAAQAVLQQAAGQWHGEFLSDLAALELEPHLSVYLHERRMVAVEGRIEAAIAAGQAVAVVAELESLLLNHPLREQLWRLLIVGLHATGDKAAALRAFQRARSTMREEAGLEPGPLLRDAELRVLEGDAQDLERAHNAQLVALDSRLGLQPIELDVASSSAFTIGREPDSDLAIGSDRKLSREHATVSFDSGVWRITDLDSTNGTRVNGTLIDVPTELETGTVITLGSTQLVFRGPLRSEVSMTDSGSRGGTTDLA